MTPLLSIWCVLLPGSRCAARPEVPPQARDQDRQQREDAERHAPDVDEVSGFERELPVRAFPESAGVSVESGKEPLEHAPRRVVAPRDVDLNTCGMVLEKNGEIISTGAPGSQVVSNGGGSGNLAFRAISTPSFTCAAMMSALIDGSRRSCRFNPFGWFSMK